jgi:two-component sensor histidine kinase
VSNALKYAFPNGQGGHIRIGLTQTGDDQLQLVVQDNGIGLSEEIDLRKTKSLGLKLVHTLSRQLRGQIEITSQSGTAFKISFPFHA